MQTKIGIDPGLSGAIAIVNDDEILFHDMPIIPCPWSAKKRMVDGFAFMEILKDYIGAQLTIEIVHSMPKQGVSSVFTFGQSFGTVVGIIQAMGISMKGVRPQAWKSKCGLINQGKDASRVLAIQMYPHLAEQLKLKKHNGRSDALFIATV